MFQVDSYSSNLKMEAWHSSKTLVTIYQTTGHYIPDDNNLDGTGWSKGVTVIHVRICITHKTVCLIYKTEETQDPSKCYSNKLFLIYMQHNNVMTLYARFKSKANVQNLWVISTPHCCDLSHKSFGEATEANQVLTTPLIHIYFHIHKTLQFPQVWFYRTYSNLYHSGIGDLNPLLTNGTGSCILTWGWLYWYKKYMMLE
jgi:hypothetical protein